MVNHIKVVDSIDQFWNTPFVGEINAIGWVRALEGDFSEIIEKLHATENMHEISIKVLQQLELSKAGDKARTAILDDYDFLKIQGSQPTLNILHYYQKDEDYVVYPTDVYSWHIDRAPIETATILCTYHGDSSDIVDKAIPKINIETYRESLKKYHDPNEESFEEFLKTNYFDLHYEITDDASITNLGNGNLWKLAVDHPLNKVDPCVHRAPIEQSGEPRLLLIC